MDPNDLDDLVDELEIDIQDIESQLSHVRPDGCKVEWRRRAQSAMSVKKVQLARAKLAMKKKTRASGSQEGFLQRFHDAAEMMLPADMFDEIMAEAHR